MTWHVQNAMMGIADQRNMPHANLGRAPNCPKAQNVHSPGQYLSNSIAH